MRDSAACGESRGTKGRTDAHYQPNSRTQLVGDHIDCVIYSYDNKFLVFKQVPMFKCYYRHFRAPKFKKLEEKCQENLRIQFFLLPRQSSLYWGLTDSRGKMHRLPWRESIISSKKTQAEGQMWECIALFLSFCRRSCRYNHKEANPVTN